MCLCLYLNLFNGQIFCYSNFTKFDLLVLILITFKSAELEILLNYINTIRNQIIFILKCSGQSKKIIDIYIETLQALFDVSSKDRQQIIFRKHDLKEKENVININLPITVQQNCKIIFSSIFLYGISLEIAVPILVTACIIFT